MPRKTQPNSHNWLNLSTFLLIIFALSASLDLFVLGDEDEGPGDVCTLKGVIKKRSRSSSAKYYMQVPNGKPAAYQCPSGQRFSVEKCVCVSPEAARFEEEAETELRLGLRDENGIKRCPEDEKKGIVNSVGAKVVNAQNETGWSRLHAAAWHGSIKVVRALIEQGANIFIENEDKETPLHLAALRNHLSVIEALYDAAGDQAHRRRLIFAKNRQGQTPFFYAIQGRSLVAASKLLDFGAAVDTIDTDRMEPIHYAVKYDQREIIEFLVRHGARLTSKCCFSPRRRTSFHLGAEYNAVDTFSGRLAQQLENYVRRQGKGRDLMCLAAEKGSLGFAKLLVRIDSKLASEPKCSFGANKQHRARRGHPLHVAAYNNHESFVEFLLKRPDVDVDCLDSRGSTALMEAIRNTASSELIRLILDSNARVEIRDKFGRTPFLVAAERSMVAVGKMLVQRLANPFVFDNKGQSAFHLASGVAFLEFLLTFRRADDYIDQKTKSEAGSLTPLHEAIIERKSHDFVAMLLDRGVDPTIAEEWNKYTPLHFAIETGSTGVLLTLLRHRAVCAKVLTKLDRHGRNVFHLAIAKNNIEAAKALLARGMYINDLVEHGVGETALHIAARQGYSEAVEFLLNKKADCSAISARDKRTPLMEALFWRHFSAAKLLLKCEDRRDLLIRDLNGRNALHLAVLHGDIGMIRAVIDAAKHADRGRALLNSVDLNGDTALHYAVRLNNLDMLQVLLEADADCTLRNNEGRTPLHVAAYLGYTHIVRDFHSRGNCELAQPDSRGRVALEYAAVKSRKLLLEDILHAYGSDSCTSVSQRLLLAVKLKMRAFVSLLLLENQGRCDLRDLLMSEHKHGATVFNYALMERDVNLIIMAFDLDIVGMGDIDESPDGMSRKSSESSNAHPVIRGKESRSRSRSREGHGRRWVGHHAPLTREMSRDLDHHRRLSEPPPGVAPAHEHHHVGTRKRTRRDEGSEMGQTMIKQLMFGQRAEVISGWIEAIQKQLVDENSPKCVDFGPLMADEKTSVDTLAGGDDSSEEGQNPAHDEQRKMQTKQAVQLLIERTGVDVNVQIDEAGNRLLHYLAVDGCNVAAASVLLERRADPNAVNKAGLTPLHLVALSKNRCAARLAELLVRHGAKPDVAAAIQMPDGDSQLTPIHLSASRCGNIQVIDAFIGMTLRRKRKESGDFGHLLLGLSINPSLKNETSGNETVAMPPIKTSEVITSTPTTMASTSFVESRVVILRSNNNLETSSQKPAFASNNQSSMSYGVEESPLTIALSRNNLDTETPLDDKAMKEQLATLLKKTKLGKSVSWMAIENNRFDVLERLESIGGEEFSIFKSPALSRARISRDIQQKNQPADAFVACRYVVNQCERKIADLVDLSSSCSRQLVTYKQSEIASLDFLRRAVAHSSDIVEIKSNLRKKFYFVVQRSTIHDQAESACMSRGGTLAQIRTEQERKLLATLKPEDLESPSWIGLKRGKTDPNQFWWTSGTPLSQDLEIQGSTSSNCATLTGSSDGSFSISATSCSDQVEGSLCELEFPQPSYWIIRGSFTWQQANEACQESSNKSAGISDGLVMPKHRTLLDYLLKMNGWPESQSGWQGCWVGLRRLKMDRGENDPKFQWNDMTHLEPLDNIPWLPGQPASVGGPDDCVELFGLKHMEPGRGGKFNDLPCDFRLHCAICYRD